MTTVITTVIVIPTYASIKHIHPAHAPRNNTPTTHLARARRTRARPRCIVSIIARARTRALKETHDRHDVARRRDSSARASGTRVRALVLFDVLEMDVIFHVSLESLRYSTMLLQF